MGHAVDQNLLSLVQQDVKKLIMDYKTTEELLAQQRLDLTAMQNIVTSIQDQQSATRAHVEEHDEQLTAVKEWKEQQMNENEQIVLKLESVEEMLRKELLIRVAQVEQRVEGVEQRFEGMEKGNVERDDKIERVEKKVKQLKEAGRSQRMKEDKPG